MKNADELVELAQRLGVIMAESKPTDRGRATALAEFCKEQRAAGTTADELFRVVGRMAIDFVGHWQTVAEMSRTNPDVLAALLQVGELRMLAELDADLDG